MITNADYMQIVSEAYDLSDPYTRKNVIFCNEAKRQENIENIVGRLYTHIKNDVTAIDFGTIPRSKGVITKIDNYNALVDCINSIHDLVKSYNEPTKSIDELTTAIANIKSRERLFTKAFTLNIEFPIMLYNMTVTAIISSTSLLMSSSVEFIKNGHDSFTTALDKVGYTKSREHLMIEYVTQFNRNCVNGTIDKLINGCVKNNLVSTKESGIIDIDYTELNEGIFFDQDSDNPGRTVPSDLTKALTGLATGAGAKAILPTLAGNPVGMFIGVVIGVGISAVLFLWMFKKVAFFVLKTRMDISDWFEIQAQYLQINAENLKYREDGQGEDHKKKVYTNQMKWVDRFKKIANKLALKDSKARKETEDNERDEGNHRYDDDDDYGNDDGGLF